VESHRSEKKGHPCSEQNGWNPENGPKQKEQDQTCNIASRKWNVREALADIDRKLCGHSKVTAAATATATTTVAAAAAPEKENSSNDSKKRKRKQETASKSEPSSVLTPPGPDGSEGSGRKPTGPDRLPRRQSGGRRKKKTKTSRRA
jgi:hypothetical protein